MKRVVQIFVDNKRLDLFDDENIEYTSKIQDVRDIKMVFSDFTQTFTIPASDTNNKVFKHFYKTNITSNFFDARKKVDAEIFINHASFKTGKVFLNGVNMKMKKPSSYEIVFYSNLIKLKDLIGDDELESLSYLSNYDHEYSSTNVSNGLQDGLDLNSQTDSIIYPLITSKKRLFYNSSSSLAFQDNFDGNIYHNPSNPNSQNIHRGLEYSDLKPALRVLHIIEAIESKYSVSFTRDVTGSTNNFFSSTAFSNLYMWLSRNKDNINEYSSGNTEESFVRTLKSSEFNTTSLNIDNVSYTNEVFSITTDGTSTQNYDMTVLIKTVSNQDKEYTIKITNVDTGSIVASNKTKGDNGSVGFLINNNTIGTVNLKVSVSSTIALDITPKVTFLFNTGTDDDAVDVTETYDKTDTTLSLITNINILDHIPKMKVIDFLGGLFKMFNLTAFFVDDRSNTAEFSKIKVQTLDTFYTSATSNPSAGTIDITDFIDIRQHRVDVSLPFNEIDLKYQEPKTLLAEEHRERFNKIFGDAEFKLEEVFPDEIDRGTKYEIQLPFEHMKFERLLDLGDADLAATEIQVGYSAKGDFRFEEGVDTNGNGLIEVAADKASKGNYEPILTKPLLFYGINKTSITTKINYNDGSTNLGLTKYFRPSNTNEEGSNEASPLETGTTTSTVENKLVDSGQNFTSTLAVGDVVKNTTDNTTTLVKTVDSDTQLSLQSNIFTTGEGYKIFRPPAHTLNFDNEVDEYQLIDYNGTTNSLYKKFYKTYVESVFNKAKRIYKYNAYLPASFMIQFRLNDQLKIQDKVYRINSINTNLTTGEASLELLNLTTDEQL